MLMRQYQYEMLERRRHIYRYARNARTGMHAPCSFEHFYTEWASWIVVYKCWCRLYSPVPVWDTWTSQACIHIPAQCSYRHVAVSNWSSKKTVMKLLRFESRKIMFFCLLWKRKLKDTTKAIQNMQKPVRSEFHFYSGRRWKNMGELLSWFFNTTISDTTYNTQGVL